MYLDLGDLNEMLPWGDPHFFEILRLIREFGLQSGCGDGAAISFFYATRHAAHATWDF